MSDFLASMAASSRARVAAARRAVPEAQIWRLAESAPEPPQLKLSPQRFDVIAEVKLRSPAVGQLAGGDTDVSTRVTSYARAGAAAVSVLTEPDRFEGSLEHLEQAARALSRTGVPAMRKDFLVEPYQVAEARLAGAGGILVIVRMLSRAGLDALIEAAARLKLFVLIEAFDERDIDVAADLVAAHGARGVPLLVGVNSRDLVTLKVVPGRLEELAPRLPTGVPRVAESGLGSAGDAARLARAGYEMALVGSALMTAPDPAALLAAMIAAGRGAR
ncbi:MAG: indole-3-glycerol-phosphate synthase [Pseudomonadota bacterium]|jgi:indole-3-glycerol phosphate synthase|nr:MAG: indole-3-glycerol-phosphate synthase TrpC [Pseudomonadota bacterium]